MKSEKTTERKRLILMGDEATSTPPPAAAAIRNRWWQTVMKGNYFRSCRTPQTPFTYASERVDILDAMLDIAADEVADIDRLETQNSELQRRLEASDSYVYLLEERLEAVGWELDALKVEVKSLKNRLNYQSREALVEETGELARERYRLQRQNQRLQKSHEALRKAIVEQRRRYDLKLAKTLNDKNNPIRALRDRIADLDLEI